MHIKDNADGSFEVVWDENNPEEAIFNTWTKQDFIDYLKKRMEEDKYSEEREILQHAI